MKVKELESMFDCIVGLSYNDSFIGFSHQLELNHWIFECEVKNIIVGEYEVCIKTSK